MSSEGKREVFQKGQNHNWEEFTLSQCKDKAMPVLTMNAMRASWDVHTYKALILYCYYFIPRNHCRSRNVIMAHNSHTNIWRILNKE